MRPARVKSHGPQHEGLAALDASPRAGNAGRLGRATWQRDARVTISSDDPMCFGCSVAGDLRQVGELTELDVERHTRYANEVAFTDEATRGRLAEELASFWAHRDPGWGGRGGGRYWIRTSDLADVNRAL